MILQRAYNKIKKTVFILSNSFFAVLILLSSTLIQAQTGPGGVGNSTNNKLWVSGDNGVYSNAGTTLASNGGNVQQWNDRSGNSSNLTQTVTANKPTYNTTNAINGIPIIRYTAANSDFLWTSLTGTAGVATVYAVARYSSLPSTNPGIIQGSPSLPSSGSTDLGTNKNIGMWVRSSNNKLWGRGIQSNGTSLDIPDGSTTAANATYLYCNIYGGSAINQYLNGAASSSVSYNNTLSPWTYLFVGRQGTESWNGDIAEVIVYNTNINAAQKIIVDNYLAAKYGISLSANDIYTMDNTANGDFDYNVAGIGQTAAGINQTDSQGLGILEISNPNNLGNGEFFIWGDDNGAIGQSFFDLPSGMQVRLQRIWRASEVGDVGTMTMVFDLTSIVSSISNGASGTNALRLIIDTNNDGSFADETTGTGGVISGASRPTGNSGIFTWTGVNITDGQRFTIASTSTANAALPIELMQFGAIVNDNNVKLSWATASEKNSDYFSVEKSTDGVSFTELTKISTIGNSQSPKYYNYVDMNPNDGVSYYRLKQTEKSGDYRYSKIISANFNASSSTILIFPNPTSEDLYVFFATSDNKKNKTVGIQNVYGEILSEFSTTNSSLRLDLSSLASGVYFIKILDGDEMTVKRVVKE